MKYSSPGLRALIERVGWEGSHWLKIFENLAWPISWRIRRFDVAKEVKLAIRSPRFGRMDKLIELRELRNNK